MIDAAASKSLKWLMSMVASLFPSRTVPELLPWYPQIKMAHISLVVASGMFAWRGAMVPAGRTWVMGRHWRMFSYVIDTDLLAAGATLGHTLTESIDAPTGWEPSLCLCLFTWCSD